MVSCFPGFPFLLPDNYENCKESQKMTVPMHKLVSVPTFSAKVLHLKIGSGLLVEQSFTDRKKKKTQIMVKSIFISLRSESKMETV